MTMEHATSDRKALSFVTRLFRTRTRRNETNLLMIRKTVGKECHEVGFCMPCRVEFQGKSVAVTGLVLLSVVGVVAVDEGRN